MVKAFKKIGNAIAGVENWLTIVTFMAMVVITIMIVLCRYVFHVQFTAGEEIARYLMIWCGYAGAALGFREHAHVGVVVFAEKLPKSWQPIIIKLRHLLSTIVVIILFYVACQCFNQFVETGKLTVVTRIPTAAVYIIIPIALALGIIHTIVDIVDDFSPKEEDTANNIDREGGDQ